MSEPQTFCALTFEIDERWSTDAGRRLLRTILVYMADSITTATAHALDGHVAQALALLRGGLEGASVVGGVSVMEADDQVRLVNTWLATLTDLRAQGAGVYRPATVKKDTVKASTLLVLVVDVYALGAMYSYVGHTSAGWSRRFRSLQEEITRWMRTVPLVDED